MLVAVDSLGDHTISIAFLILLFLFPTSRNSTVAIINLIREEASTIKYCTRNRKWANFKCIMILVHVLLAIFLLVYLDVAGRFREGTEATMLKTWEGLSGVENITEFGSHAAWKIALSGVTIIGDIDNIFLSAVATMFVFIHGMTLEKATVHFTRTLTDSQRFSVIPAWEVTYMFVQIDRF